MFTDDLLSGIIQVKDRASLTNPVLKLFLVFASLLLSIFQFTFYRYYSDWNWTPNIAQQCLISLTLIIASSVDLRDSGRHRFLWRTLFFGTILASISFAESGHVSMLEVLWNKFLGMWSMLPLLQRIEGTTWLGIVDIYAAFLAFSNLNNRNFIWFGRRIILPSTRQMYQVFVVTIAVLASAAPRVGAEVYWIARMRYRLLQNPACNRENKKPIDLFFNIMFIALLYRFSYVAQVIERLLEDRGYFEEPYTEPMEGYTSQSDIVAIVMLVVGVASVLLVGSTPR